MRAQSLDTDVLVIGGGAAGCAAALAAQTRGARVQMIVKGKMGRSGATPLASALMSAAPPTLPRPLMKLAVKAYRALPAALRPPMPQRERAALARTMGFHHWLVDQDYFVDFGLWSLEHFFPALEQRGLYVPRDETGKPATALAGAPTYNLQSHGMSGYQYGEAKRKDVLAAGVPVMEEAMVYRLLPGAGGDVAGAMVLDYRTGRHLAVRAKATILATGHTNWLATRATGTREMAANGYAMAARAGAELQNLEIQWFHGSDMAAPESWMRLHHYPNPMTGSKHRAVMMNGDGEEYMRIEDYDVNMPYTIQLKKLYAQVNAGKASWDRGSFAQYGRVDPAMLKKHQYHWEFYEKLGLDMGTDKLESGVTWHMSAGGIRADIRSMATAVPGLYIAGAVGAHMLGGLSFCAYDGELAGASAARHAAGRATPAPDSRAVEAGEAKLGALLAGAGTGGGLSPIEAKRRVRALVWDTMMYRKNAQTLGRAIADLDALRREVLPRIRLRTGTLRFNTDLMDALDVEDMIDVAEMTARASLAREESRGPHFREDFPFTDDDNWLKRVVVSWREGKVALRTEPVPQPYVKPERGRLDYLDVPTA